MSDEAVSTQFDVTVTRGPMKSVCDDDETTSDEENLAGQTDAVASSPSTSVGGFLTEPSTPTKIVVRPGIERRFRPEDRHLTFRYINSAQLYKNRIFNHHHSHIEGVIKSIAKGASTESGAIKTTDFPAIVKDAGIVNNAGLELDSKVENNVSKLTNKLEKAHGSELSMMQVVGYMQRIRKLCTEKISQIKYRKKLKRLVFLGGSCNPTTWRKDLLMPLLQTRKYTYFNPQVEDWTPSCVYEEAIAKNEAKILYFVIDNRTRALASMIEVVENICAGRICVLVIKDIELGSTITGKIVDENEARELNLARAYLADIGSRYGLLVFNDIKFAAHYMCDFVVPKIENAKLSPSAIKHRHSTAGSTRAAYGNLGHLLIQQEEGIFNESVFYTNRLVSCSCPFTVHDVLERALEESKSPNMTPSVIHKCFEQHGVPVTPRLEETVKAQLDRTTDHHQVVLFVEEIVRDHLRKAREDQTNFDLHHDVYLGGSCNKYTTWRAEIAIPVFESANISYFNPRSLDFKTNNIYEELRAKCGSLIIMYVVDSNCRGLSTMIDAVEMISKQEQRIVLVVKDVIPGVNPTIDPKEYKDLNRARAYLADVATRHGLLVYSSVKHAVEYAAEKIKLLKTYSGKNERWSTLSTAEHEPTIELDAVDLLGKDHDLAEKSNADHISPSYGEMDIVLDKFSGELMVERHGSDISESKKNSAAEASAADPAAAAATNGVKDTPPKSRTKVCTIM